MRDKHSITQRLSDTMKYRLWMFLVVPIRVTDICRHLHMILHSENVSYVFQYLFLSCIQSSILVTECCILVFTKYTCIRTCCCLFSRGGSARRGPGLRRSNWCNWKSGDYRLGTRSETTLGDGVKAESSHASASAADDDQGQDWSMVDHRL